MDSGDQLRREVDALKKRERPQNFTIVTTLERLNAYEIAARNDERERIIKLLEEAKPLQVTDELEWGIEQAIALIKGENK
jgi:hypothetical protein